MGAEVTPNAGASARSTGLSLARRGLHALNALLPNGRGGLTVLAYHLVGGGTRAPVDLPLEAFHGHLDELGGCGRVVALDEGLAALAGRSADDEHLIALTFDDAFGNFYDTIWPRLRERSLPATLYVPVGFVEGTSPSPLAGAESLPAMEWDQIGEVAESGQIAIGSHTVTHPDLRRLSASECERELAESQRLLAERIGREVRSFCYPKALWSRPVRALVAERYGNAVIGGGRRNRAPLDPHRVQRLPIRRDMPRSLATLLRKPVWLEEWAAGRARGLRG